MKDPVKRCLRVTQISGKKVTEVSLLGKREKISGLQRSKGIVMT